MDEIKSIRNLPIHTSKGGACDAIHPQNRSKESLLHSHMCVQLEAVGLCNTPLCNERIESSSMNHLQPPSLRVDVGTKNHLAEPSQRQSRIAGTMPSLRLKRKQSHPRMRSHTLCPSPGSPSPCLLASPLGRWYWSFHTAATGRTSTHYSNRTA